MKNSQIYVDTLTKGGRITIMVRAKYNLNTIKTPRTMALTGICGAFFLLPPCCQTSKRDNLTCNIFGLLAEPINILLRKCRTVQGVFLANQNADRCLRIGQRIGQALGIPRAISFKHMISSFSSGRDFLISKLGPAHGFTWANLNSLITPPPHWAGIPRTGIMEGMDAYGPIESR